MKRSAFEGDDERAVEANVNADFARNDPVLPENELVLLHGPPMCGKTRYFQERLAQRGFVRVSAEDMFRLDPNLNLRAVVKKVVAFLIQGLNVCVDDGNMKPETRKAYLDMLSKKAPQVPCRAICFWPFGGFRQCLWARECCIAERQQSTNCAGVVDIQEWFSTLSRKPPKRFEGFVSVLNVRSYLSSPVPFDHPCLFVDAGSLCGFEAVPGTDSFHCVVKRREDTEWVLRDWCSENPRGLIAILALESQLFPASVEMYADEDDPLVYFELLELYHSALVSSLREVVGKIGGGRAELLGTRYNSGDMHWWNCPSPGMIAFAQRVHKIDLNASMMVCSESSGFWGLARELGLSTIRDELLFQSKRTCGWSLSDRLRKMSVSPSVNKNSDWLFTRLLSEGGEEKECEKNGEVAGCFWTTLLDRNDTAAPTNVPRFGVDQVCARKCAFEEGFEEDDQLRENEDVVKKEDEPRPSQMQKLGD